MKNETLALGAAIVAGIGAVVYFGGGKGEEGEMVLEEEEVRAKKIVTTPIEMISRVQTKAVGLTPAQSTAHKIMSGIGFTMAGIPMTQPIHLARTPERQGIPVTKKYAEISRVGLGYKGYVTPKTPTPVSPGYITGVTTFKRYTEPTYIPSPVKPPSVSYMKTTPKKQPTSSDGGSYRTGTRRTSVTGKYTGR